MFIKIITLLFLRNARWRASIYYTLTSKMITASNVLCKKVCKQIQHTRRSIITTSRSQHEMHIGFVVG
jgi:hypothetical protein